MNDKEKVNFLYYLEISDFVLEAFHDALPFLVHVFDSFSQRVQQSGITQGTEGVVTFTNAVYFALVVTQILEEFLQAQRFYAF